MKAKYDGENDVLCLLFSGDPVVESSVIIDYSVQGNICGY
jgi:uncharacterized protein YuzE